MSKLYKKQSFCTRSTLLYISLPSLHDYGVKMPNFTFHGGRKQATTKLSFSLVSRNLPPGELPFI